MLNFEMKRQSITNAIANYMYMSNMNILICIFGLSFYTYFPVCSFSVRVPFFANLEKPSDFGLNATLNFKIPSTDDVNLGAW